MSDKREINAGELENATGGKNSGPFKVIRLPQGGCVYVRKIPERITDEEYDFVLRDGDHFVVIGETINDMVPIRVLKNGVSGFIPRYYVVD